MMGKIISYLLFFLFLVAILSAGLSFLAYRFGGEKLPLQEVIKAQLMDRFFPPDSTVPDTMLTVEQLLNLDLKDKEEEIFAELEILKNEKIRNQSYRDSLDQIKASLETSIQQKKQAETQGIESMAKLIDPMKAENAAPILSELDDRTIIRVLTRVKDRQAAKILEAMDKDRAIEIMTKMGRGVK